MASKPILYYCLVRGWSHSRGTAFTVLGVTSEKGRQVYGRDEQDGVTHVSERDVLYRFPAGTALDFAKAAGDRAATEAKKHEVGIRLAREDLARLEDLKARCVLTAAKGKLVGDISQLADDTPGRRRSADSYSRVQSLSGRSGQQT